MLEIIWFYEYICGIYQKTVCAVCVLSQNVYICRDEEEEEEVDASFGRIIACAVTADELLRYLFFFFGPHSRYVMFVWMDGGEASDIIQFIFYNKHFL